MYSTPRWNIERKPQIIYSIPIEISKWNPRSFIQSQTLLAQSPRREGNQDVSSSFLGVLINFSRALSWRVFGVGTTCVWHYPELCPCKSLLSLISIITTLNYCNSYDPQELFFQWGMTFAALLSVQHFLSASLTREDPPWQTWICWSCLALEKETFLLPWQGMAAWSLIAFCSLAKWNASLGADTKKNFKIPNKLKSPLCCGTPQPGI